MNNIIYIYAGLLLTLLASCSQRDTKMHEALGLNESASIHALADLPENPLLLHGINSSIQLKDGTLSTLYGNEVAYNHARSHVSGNYPAGTVLYYVTWQSGADEQWFGAKVPQMIKTVEQIRFADDQDVQYTLFSGNKRESVNSSSEARVNLIRNIKIAAFAE